MKCNKPDTGRQIPQLTHTSKLKVLASNKRRGKKKKSKGRGKEGGQGGKGEKNM